jgi:hypothetical protein
MQFEAGAQPERGVQGPFPPLDPRYPDLPRQKWYEYGVKEGIPRLLDLWDAKGIKVTSHMVGQAVERNPQLARDIVSAGRRLSSRRCIFTIANRAAIRSKMPLRLLGLSRRRPSIRDEGYAPNLGTAPIGERRLPLLIDADNEVTGSDFPPREALGLFRGELS